MARRYSKKASASVERAMKKRKKGTLKSGRSGRKVKSRKQAIAIGLSEARKRGAKVPKRAGKKRSSRRQRSGFGPPFRMLGSDFQTRASDRSCRPKV
jgi:hypothetical protein